MGFVKACKGGTGTNGKWKPSIQKWIRHAYA